MIEIRSYRRVFALERRIYRVDRLRLNPGGVPVRGVVYFLAILAAAVLFGHVPPLGTVGGLLPWYLRYLALPAGSAALLTVIRIEGRPFHLAARALVRYHSGPARLVCLRPCQRRACPAPGQRWRPQPVLWLPDGSDSRMRRLRYRGPGVVLISVAHERELSRAGVQGLLRRQPRLILRQRQEVGGPTHGQVVVLERAAELHVR